MKYFPHIEKIIIEYNLAAGEKMQIEPTPTTGNETVYEKASF